MRAVLILRPGGADQIVVREAPKPQPGAKQILVCVKAASVNPLDWKIRRTALRFLFGARFPFIPGFDFAGVIEQTGAEVRQFKKGDAVYGCTGTGGCHAEYVAIDHNCAALKPESMTFAAAAALPGAGLTALQALHERSRTRPGMRILINGASGGVGSCAVQIAVALGASVTAITSGKNIDYVRKLGAERVIDYTREHLSSVSGTFDVFFDVVPNQSFFKCKRLLNSNGLYLTTLPGPGPFVWRLLTRIGSLVGYHKQCWWIMMKPSTEGLAKLTELFQAGRLLPQVGQTFALAEAAAAHRLSESGHARGKLVIVIE